MILNLVHKSEGDIDYSISRFPDGEVQITLGEFAHKENIVIKCRITNAEELFILCQVMDILDRHDVVYSVEIYYLMSMRMDRVMDFNRPFSLLVVSKILTSFKCKDFNILEVHSDALMDRELPFYDLYNEELSSLRDMKSEYQYVFPDAGAKERYTYNNNSVITCSKVRDLETGRIKEIKIDNPEKLDGHPLMVMDDLCDAGGTFCGIAEALGKLGVTKDKLNISVVHMVNRKGIENLSKYYNTVSITNSYKDWEDLPENVTMTKVV